jgi:hypothetical protein
MQNKITHETLEMVILQGLLHVNRKWWRWSLFMVATSQKIHSLCPCFALIKYKKSFFAKETLICIVAFHDKMHKSPKNRVIITIFLYEFCMIILIWVESQSDSYIIPKYVKYFFLKYRYTWFGILHGNYNTYYDSLRKFSISLIFFLISLGWVQIWLKFVGSSIGIRWMWPVRVWHYFGVQHL